MMSSQLGRVILSTTTASEDEMRARPGEDDEYGPVGDYLEQIATEVESESGE